jgi:hypothetical protein
LRLFVYIAKIVSVAPIKQAIGKSDVVELMVPVYRTEGVGKWPAGTTGTVVEGFGGSKVVEIPCHCGGIQDFLTVPIVQLKLITKRS